MLASRGVGGARPDFVLLLGDDASDEPAFAALEAWRAELPTAASTARGAASTAPPAAYGVTVGQRHSRTALTLALPLTLTLPLTIDPNPNPNPNPNQALARRLVPRRAGGRASAARGPQVGLAA